MKYNISEYETVILCGPIWLGRLIPPLRNFLLRYGDCIQKLAKAFPIELVQSDDNFMSVFQERLDSFIAQITYI
jgi:menaquinone-dependent protoporphyrinogen IX oxidase